MIQSIVGDVGNGKGFRLRQACRYCGLNLAEGIYSVVQLWGPVHADCARVIRQRDDRPAPAAECTHLWQQSDDLRTLECIHCDAVMHQI